uniref:Uncharacterized protein n=1 Tax=Mycena chlorophos TaxID=658473 RepID=A0ABQ0LLL9_MYCCL|nr:predicted protein [Mycena chlorophos]
MRTLHFESVLDFGPFGGYEWISGQSDAQLATLEQIRNLLPRTIPSQARAVERSRHRDAHSQSIRNLFSPLPRTHISVFLHAKRLLDMRRVAPKISYKTRPTPEGENEFVSMAKLSAFLYLLPLIFAALVASAPVAEMNRSVGNVALRNPSPVGGSNPPGSGDGD